MRERVWYEFVHSKFGESYLALYINKQKSRKKWFKIITLIFSTSGILGWKLWDYAPIVACGIISIMQVINLVENEIILSETEIDKICTLRNRYVQYTNQLEKLFIDSKTKAEKEIKELFYEYRKLGEEIEALDNDLHIQQIKSLISKANSQTRTYLNQYHKST